MKDTWSPQMKTLIKTTLLALGAVAVLGSASMASAETAWQANHPRRAEVNHRLAHLNHRIMRERKEGELTKMQARDLRTENRGIRAQERFDASKHHGRLTKREQHKLNREENGVSRQVGR
jgi:hypothetical protein